MKHHAFLSALCKLAFSGYQAFIEERVGYASHARLRIAPSSHVRIIVLLLLLITTSICIDYREQLADLPDSLMLRYGSF